METVIGGFVYVIAAVSEVVLFFHFRTSQFKGRHYPDRLPLTIIAPISYGHIGGAR